MTTKWSVQPEQAPEFIPEGDPTAGVYRAQGHLGPPGSGKSTLRPLPRPSKLEIQGASKPDRRRTPVTANAPLRRVFVRAIHWFLNLIRYFVRATRDRLAGRKDPKYFGIRLRQLFEEMGGTAIKIGQQLSVRIDLFPLAVCHELAKLRDSVPAIKVEEAIDIIERAAGHKRGLERVPLHEIFEGFDPTP